MLTVQAEQRATILDICSHWWVNEGYSRSCLEEAEYLASLTPVRLDLLLSLTRQDKKDRPSDDQDHSEVRMKKIYWKIYFLGTITRVYMYSRMHPD